MNKNSNKKPRSCSAIAPVSGRGFCVGFVPSVQVDRSKRWIVVIQ
jgi:hypothetical protein